MELEQRYASIFSMTAAKTRLRKTSCSISVSGGPDGTPDIEMGHLFHLLKITRIEAHRSDGASA
jgi:hypothetical protein